MVGTATAADAGVMRQRWRGWVSGRVQGVGFRPYVWRLAVALDLVGWVANTARGVELEVEGDAAALAAWWVRFGVALPPLAVIEAQGWQAVACQPAVGFVIVPTEGAQGQLSVPADMAPCAACVAEMFGEGGRHHHHPFVNCTHCGPRYSVVTALPYHRAHTTLAGFAQCPACQAAYESPADRRFHAEPNCCVDCGPVAWFEDGEGRRQAGDAVAQAAAVVAGGGVLLLKSAGGFHLVCDATQAAAVARIRAWKQRPRKPLAVMVVNEASARRYVVCSAAAAQRLNDLSRPVVLLPKTAAGAALPAVAPAQRHLGVFLPVTPLHYLLFHHAAGQPAGQGWLDCGWPMVWVMTSANPKGAPVVIDNAAARAGFGGVVDGMLLHDRPIAQRVDDSVEQWLADRPRVIRRARGHVPLPQRLLPAVAGAGLIATGSFLKNAPCVVNDGQAVVGSHVGDLQHPAACEALVESVERLWQWQAGTAAPRLVVSDWGQHFAASYGQQLAARWGVPYLAVQHHHAHVAAVCAEHGLVGPVLGVALDGFGLGEAGQAWGGELLWVKGARFERCGQLAPLTLLGGDAATREPWRLAVAWLWEQGLMAEVDQRFAAYAAHLPLLHQQWSRRLHCPTSSSMGRYFDLVAALAGFVGPVEEEGEAAQWLENLAGEPVAAAAVPMVGEVLSLTPLLQQLLTVAEPAAMARQWHEQLVAALAGWVLAAVERTGEKRVVLAGGCLVNGWLALSLRQGLVAAGCEVWLAERYPCGDGGLALGQAWVGQQRLAEGMAECV